MLDTGGDIIEPEYFSNYELMETCSRPIQFQSWSTPGDHLAAAARRGKDGASPPTSYIDRITCPTRQEFYKNLEQEVYSQLHCRRPKANRNIQQETKKNNEQKAHNNSELEEAILQKTIALLSVQIAEREREIDMSELPLMPRNPKRPHRLPFYTVTPDEETESEEEKEMQGLSVKIINTQRSNECDYDGAENAAVKTSQSVPSPKCSEGNPGDQSNILGLVQEQRLEQGSPGFEQSRGLDSEASIECATLSPGSSHIQPDMPSAQIGKNILPIQDKTIECKLAKKNSVLYNMKNVSGSPPSKNSQPDSPATLSDNGGPRRKGKPKKAELIIEPVAINNTSTKCHYLSSSQTLHVDIRPAVHQPAPTPQSTPTTVKNYPQPKPRKLTLPITQRSSSSEYLSANRILSPIFRRMNTYGPGLYPRVIADNNGSKPIVYRMPLPRKEPSPTPVYCSPTTQGISSARSLMRRNIQPHNHCPSTNLNTVTDDSKRNTPSVNKTKTSRLRSDAAASKRMLSPDNIQASGRINSASVARTNTRLPEGREAGSRVRSAQIKPAEGTTPQFRFSRGPLRQTLTRSSDGKARPNTLDNIPSTTLIKPAATPQRLKKVSDERPADKQRSSSKKSTHCSRCEFQERGKAVPRTRPSNRAFVSLRGKSLNRQASSHPHTSPGRPRTSPPLRPLDRCNLPGVNTSEAATWLGRKFSEEAASLTRFKSRSPRFKKSPSLTKLSHNETAQPRSFLNKPTQSQRSDEVAQSQRLNRCKYVDNDKQSPPLKPTNTKKQPQQFIAKSSPARFMYDIKPTPLARLPSTERINLMDRLRPREGSPLFNFSSPSDRTGNGPVNTANTPQDLNANQTTAIYTAYRNNTKSPDHNTLSNLNNRHDRSPIICKKLTDSTESHLDLLNKLSTPAAMKCFKKSLSFHRTLVARPSSRRQSNRMTILTKTHRLSNDNIRSLAANVSGGECISPGTPTHYNNSRQRDVSLELMARDFRKWKPVTVANNGSPLDSSIGTSEGCSQTYSLMKNMRK